MDAIFLALLNEGKFTAELLSAGATQIGTANYASRGVYFQAFTSLSTGLERIGKLCILLDHYIDSGDRFPDNDVMKGQFRHDLGRIYRQSLEIKSKRNFHFNYLPNLDSVVHQNILSILSDFAKGDRYANIDRLTGVESTDPITRWHNDVDIPLFKGRVSERTKQKVVRNAELIDHLLSPYSVVRHHGEDGQEINSLLDASFRSGMWEAVAPYRRLNVLQIIRYWSELLVELQYESMKNAGDVIPFFSELFAKFFNKDAYLKSRKVWTGI